MPKIYESPDGGKTIKEREINDYQNNREIVDGYQFDNSLKEPKRWTLIVEETKIEETDELDYFITFPEDLMEAANLNEGDLIEWIDQGDGSFLLKKVEDKTSATYNDMVADGYIMTDDGFWIKEG